MTVASDASRAGRGGRLLAMLASGIALAGVARATMLGVHAMLGRELGPAEYGRFVFALGLATILAQIASLGWQSLIPRFISEYSVGETWGLLRGALRRSLQVTAAVGLAICMLLGMLGGSGVLGPERANPLLLAAVLVLPLALRRLFRRELVGFAWPRLGIAVDGLVTPIGMLAIVLGRGLPSAAAAALCFAGLSALAAVIGALAVRRVTPRPVRAATIETADPQWLRATLNGLTGRIARALTNRVDLLMLGPLLGMQMVGLYSAAHRLTFFLSFIPILIGGMMSPYLARAFYAGDLPRVRRLFLISMAAAASIGVLIAPVLILAPEVVIRAIYGEDFQGAVDLVPILAFGQLVFTVSGPVAALLTMTGLEGIYARSAVVVLGFSIVANYFAIITVGVVGVAWVTTLSLIALQIWQLRVVARHIGLLRPRSHH